MQKKSLSDLFSKQQSVWQFTAFIKHYMVEFYHRSALISQSLQQVPAAYMLRWSCWHKSTCQTRGKYSKHKYAPLTDNSSIIKEPHISLTKFTSIWISWSYVGFPLIALSRFVFTLGWFGGLKIYGNCLLALSSLCNNNGITLINKQEQEQI